MAQNITLLGASYSAVPAVLLPKTGGGNARFDDTSDANAVASDIAQGKTAYVNGSRVTGTASGGGGATVDSKTASASGSSTLSLEFSGLLAQPKAFVVMTDAQITINTTRRVSTIMSDGTTTYGCCVYKPNGNNNGTVYYSNSWYTWSYSGGKLTVNSNSSSSGGYFNNGQYRLIYVF